VDECKPLPPESATAAAAGDIDVEVWPPPKPPKLPCVAPPPPPGLWAKAPKPTGHVPPAVRTAGYGLMDSA